MREVSVREFLTKGEPLIEDSLESAVLLSLFTDVRAEGKGGWWGHAVGPEFGSRLWLLARAKPTQETLRKAEQYAQESLAWLLEDKLAREVRVSARFEKSRLILAVQIDERKMEVSENGILASRAP